MKRLLVFVLVISLSACSRDPRVQRDKYFVSGQKYLENKKYEEATIEFRNVLRIDKGHVPSYLGIAKAFQQMGDHQHALAAFQQVIKLDSKNVEARLKMGDYMLAGGLQKPNLFKQAQQMAEEALQTEPSNVEAMLLLGNAYAGQNETDKSIEQYEKALSLDPDNLKATLNLAVAQLRKNDLVGTEATFNKALQKHPKAIEAHLAIAAFYSTTKRLQETERHLRAAFDIAPSDPRSFYSLVAFYLSVKKNAEAETVFKDAIDRNPKDREPRWGLASFYLQQKRIDQGVQAMRDLLKVKPDDSQTQLRLAEVFLDEKMNEPKAEELVQAVLAGSKNNARAYYLEGKILRRRELFDKAAMEFDAAIKLDPSLAPAYLEKANLLLTRGDLEGCEKTLNTVLQRDEANLLARGALAKVLALRQKPQEALQQAQDVLPRMPDNEDAIGARAEAYRLLGKLDESKKDWLNLCEMSPQNALYWHRLGTVEAMQSNSAAALMHFRKAIELQPNFTAAVNDVLYLQLNTKQFDAAFSELQRLSNTSFPQDELHRFRGQVYLAKGDSSAAESEFQKAIEVNPQNYQVYILLAQLKLQHNDFAQAVKEVDRLIAKNDKMPAAFLLKGYYLQVAKNMPEAIASYRKALTLDPGNPVAANNLAWLLCESNANLEDAFSLAKEAKKKAPEDPEIADTLGWIYYKMKNYTLAVDQLLFSITNRKHPTAENYYRLGMAYYAKGDAILAKQTLRKSLEVDAKSPVSGDATKVLRILSQNKPGHSEHTDTTS